ncbi:TadE family protein [Ornithinimicrobium cryptoxanthini]|uniref:Pilus assembly protein n=1 Tax=Ornithinimicrobium cryptoxanthini TaxID=2934161 RepID=A0ABY4YNS1_9MICO|nr:TadE family protein [Ornithinimicrobium cryptoxanthini]USQ77787.1 pilus assembly protein [Ornithinimicrobium cryptoxanthini]
MTRTWGVNAREAGSVSIEVVILAPVLMLFILGIVFGGRYALAQQGVQTAAADAARSASIARSAGEAGDAAASAAASSLANQNLSCASQSVNIDTGAFAAPPGTPGTVSATVTCVVDMSDLAFPGIPGNQTLTSTMTSPLDTYRSRNG